jgi:hypothetical protein
MKDYISDPKKNNNDSKETEDILKQLHGDEIISLQEEIEEIKQQIKERQELSKDIARSCEHVKTIMENVISEFKAIVPAGGAGAGDTSALGALIRLRQEQAAMDQFSIKERTDAWKDIAELKKELRELVREYREKESRIDMLDKILTE